MKTRTAVTSKSFSWKVALLVGIWCATFNPCVCSLIIRKIENIYSGVTSFIPTLKRAFRSVV